VAASRELSSLLSFFALRNLSNILAITNSPLGGGEQRCEAQQ
jgi:hypothetical protein